jgi:hypothetical protein
MWNILKVVATLAGFVLLAVLTGGSQPGSMTGRPHSRRSGSSGGGSVWTVGHGGKKGYGSWSSLRHR